MKTSGVGVIIAPITNDKKMTTRRYFFNHSEVNMPIFPRTIMTRGNSKINPNGNTKVITKVCKELNVYPHEVAFIGDRPLSDILAGINAGMTTILVDSISKDEENILVRFVRFLERLSIKK